MILTAHQPVYLPWLGLFHKIALADKFIFFDQVQYVPKDWINRNRVKGPQGPIMLTVPALRKGYLGKRIAEIEINNELPWARKHWKTIRLSYGKSKYFTQYSDFFEYVYNQTWTLLVDLNYYVLQWLLVTLGIKTELEKAGAYTFEGAKSDLVLDMCVKLGTHMYIFGALGKEYADQEAFMQAGVTPVFQDYHHPVYKQMHGDFLPNMSIIDLLFNEGPHSLDILMSGNITPTQLRAMIPNR